jgi:hypothetical protein
MAVVAGLYSFSIGFHVGVVAVTALFSPCTINLIIMRCSCSDYFLKIFLHDEINMRYSFSCCSDCKINQS